MNIITNLQKLVAFPTETGRKTETLSLFSFVRSELADLPLHFTEREYQNFPALLITTRDTKTPKIWLYCHVDVVPATTEQYQAIEQNGRLYGRGVFDMKFALASYLSLFRELGESLTDFDLGIMLVSDEEVGGFNGANRLQQEGFLSKVIIIPDGGDDLRVETKAKGIWHLTIRAEGRGAHGSRPWEGENAIEQLSDYLTALRQAVCHQDKTEKWCRTLSTGMITGGQAVNQVPDYAEAKIDIRLISNEEKTEIEHIFTSLQAEYPRVTVETDMLGSCVNTDINNHYYQSFVEITESITGVEHVPVCSYGASDARFFVSDMPAIITRPTGGGMHGAEEWLDLASFAKFHQIIMAFVQQNGQIDVGD